MIIELAQRKTNPEGRIENRKRLEVPWRKVPTTRQQEMLLPNKFDPLHPVRLMQSENRALLIASIAKARRWLNMLMSDPAINVEAIANRESCSVRKVNMTISLAFLAPGLVESRR